jgi:hypothetical protein
LNVKLRRNIAGIRFDGHYENHCQSLNQPELQKLAAQQQPSDGSWGMGINVWYPESPARNSFSF